MSLAALLRQPDHQVPGVVDADHEQEDRHERQHWRAGRAAAPDGDGGCEEEYVAQERKPDEEDPVFGVELPLAPVMLAPDPEQISDPGDASQGEHYRERCRRKMRDQHERRDGIANLLW